VAEVPSDHPFFVEAQEIEAMPGRLAIAKIETVRRVNWILRGDIAQLANLVDRMTDPAFSLPIMDARQPERHDAFLNECERLLHNAVAAVHSRVDLLRTFVSRYVAESTPALATDYQSRVDTDFVNDPAHAFLIGLRNYMLHERLPVAVGTWSFGNQGESYVYELSTGPLIAARDHFNAATREWMAGHGDTVDVVSVLRAYEQQVARFDQWFAERIEQHHRADIETFTEAVRAYNHRWHPSSRFD